MFSKTREAVRICGNTPSVEIKLRASDETIQTRDDCVLDTGCVFALVLPNDLGRTVGWTTPRPCDIRLADGSMKPASAGMTEIQWLNQWQAVDIRMISPCPKPLLGMPILKKSRIILEDADGYVERLD